MYDNTLVSVTVEKERELVLVLEMECRDPHTRFVLNKVVCKIEDAHLEWLLLGLF